MSKEPINLTGYEMKPVAWKLYEVEDGVVYRIQFDEVPWKFKKTLQQAMSDWHASLYGWHKTTGNQLFAFNKKSQSSKLLRWLSKDNCLSRSLGYTRALFGMKLETLNQ